MPRDLELDLAAEEIVRQWLDGKGASRIAAERGVTQSMVRSRLIWAGELPWPDWEIYPDWLRERDGPQTTGRRVRTLYRDWAARTTGVAATDTLGPDTRVTGHGHSIHTGDYPRLGGDTIHHMWLAGLDLTDVDLTA